MWGTVKIVVVILLLVLAALVALMFWVLCKSAQEEFKPDQKRNVPEDRCETYLRFDECQGCARERCQRQEERAGKQVPGSVGNAAAPPARRTPGTPNGVDESCQVRRKHNE